MNRIFLSPPDVGDLEAKYVERAMASGWVAPAGPELDQFESELADRVGVDHVVALSSGTAALHLGLISLGVGPGDVVLTSTLTFAATANAIAYTGAIPYFVDSSLVDGNVDVGLLAEAARQVQSSGRRLGAILPIDLLGRCADMAALTDLASQLDVPLFVDAAESMGASFDDKPAGSFGRASAMSFNGNKVMTTSGGGAFMTSDEALATQVRYLATQAREPVVHYEHRAVGYNYRLSNVLAAIGRAQLARLDEILDRRHQLREQYRALFSDVPSVTILGGSDDASDNCWLTAVIVDDDAGWTTHDLAAHLDHHDIESRPLWKPMHLQPIFSDAEALVTGTSQWLFEHGLTLPSGSGMTPTDNARVVEAIDGFLTGARDGSH